MTRRTTMWLGLACALGCGRYRPALFADCAVVTLAHDDGPIAVPSRRTFDEREQISDIYLRRPLFDVVHPTDFPTGGDVNAMDEVPPSTWFDPQSAEAEATPPQLPLTAIDDTPVTRADALVVQDARGQRYELLGDPPEQAGLRTGAAVLGGHLLRALGYHVPMAFIVRIPAGAILNGAAADRVRAWNASSSDEGERRVSATRWSNGIDVGIASDYSVRKDDPNDIVAHHDRRTLRAMRVFAHWIAWTDFGVRSTRDVYVGKPGQGHLVHYLVGPSVAFGTNEVHAAALGQELGGGFWFNLVTLGLSPPTTSAPQPSAFRSLGYLPATLTPGTFDVSPPYSPFVRLTPSDEYWAAKRLLDIGDGALLAGIAAAGFPEEAGRALADVLRSRRRLLVAHAMTVVSPIEVAATVGRSVWLRDRAVAAGLATAQATEYEIAFLDGEGSEVSPAVRKRPSSVLTEVVIPPEIAGLVVLHIQVVRSSVAAPRACDIHLQTSATAAKLVGIRH
ncbi:MAG: hypothetical protein ACXVEE_19860 [Polyangiales bacterium]